MHRNIDKNKHQRQQKLYLLISCTKRLSNVEYLILEKTLEMEMLNKM